MIMPKCLADQACRAPFAADLIDSVQSAAFGIEPEDCDAKLVGSDPGKWTHTVAGEDQPATTIRRGDRCRALNELHFQVPALVLEPAKIAGRIHVARVPGLTRCHKRVRGTEVAHPLLAQLDSFLFRRSARSRLRLLSHTTRVHAPSDSRGTRLPLSTRTGRVGGQS